jgi:N-acetylmuramic acid 6-phosphate etherase
MTESSSHYDRLEKMSVRTVLRLINREDQTVPLAIKKVIPRMEVLIKVIVDKMKNGGRLFYLGAGTSGRLGIVDASEIPPTFGVPYGKVIGLIAGGDKAIRRAVEHAEDNPHQAWRDLKGYKITKNDVLIGIAASGQTPYVVGGVTDARAKGIVTGCITCNTGSELSQRVDYPIQVVVGPEFVTGSTRLKAGTAQKLVLNMISTSVMIQLGHVKGNEMVDMKLTNNKLIRRGVRIIMEELGLPQQAAATLLKKHGSVRKVIDRRK